MPHQCTTCGRTFPDGSKEMLSGCPDCGGNKFQFKPGNRDEESETQPTEGASASDPPQSPAERAGDDGGVAGTVAEAAGTVRDWVGRDDPDRSPDDAGPNEWPAVGRRNPSDDPTRRAGASREDNAQASARTDVVDPSDLPDGPAPETDRSDGRPIENGNVESSPASEPTATEPTTEPSPERTDRPTPEDGSEPHTETEDGSESPFTGAADTDDTPDLDQLRDELNEQFESIRIVDRGQYELNLMELYDREEYIISLMEDGRYAIEVPEAWRDDH